MMKARPGGDGIFAAIVTAAFLAFGAVTAWHHEMWRDEAQAWLIARDSHSVAELYRHLRYEGHPGLWHLALMPLARVFHGLGAMQALHLAVSSATAFLVTWRAPFHRAVRVLVVFGYFFAFEYSIICRNYAFGAFLLVAFCVLFPRRHARFLSLCGVLFLLAHTSVHALILDIAMVAALLGEYLLRARALARDGSLPPLRASLGFALAGAGIATSIAPPAHSRSPRCRWPRVPTRRIPIVRSR